jgi:malate/lactate dehydrogenase
VLIVVSNPLDAMCHVAQRVSNSRAGGLPAWRDLDLRPASPFGAWETGR